MKPWKRLTLLSAMTIVMFLFTAVPASTAFAKKGSANEYGQQMKALEDRHRAEVQALKERHKEERRALKQQFMGKKGGSAGEDGPRHKSRDHDSDDDKSKDDDSRDDDRQDKKSRKGKKDK